VHLKVIPEISLTLLKVISKINLTLLKIILEVNLIPLRVILTIILTRIILEEKAGKYLKVVLKDYHLVAVEVVMS